MPKEPLGTFLEYPILFRFELIRPGSNSSIVEQYADKRNTAIKNIAYHISSLDFLSDTKLPETLVDVDTTGQHSRYRLLIMKNFYELVNTSRLKVRLTSNSISVCRHVDRFNAEELSKCRSQIKDREMLSKIEEQYKQLQTERPKFVELD